MVCRSVVGSIGVGIVLHRGMIRVRVGVRVRAVERLLRRAIRAVAGGARVALRRRVGIGERRGRMRRRSLGVRMRLRLGLRLGLGRRFGGGSGRGRLGRRRRRKCAIGGAVCVRFLRHGERMLS